MAEELPPILVGVDDENRYFIFNDETGERDYENNEAGAIAEAVAASLAEPGREVMVYGAASVEYQHVLRLLQAMQETLRRQGVETGEQEGLLRLQLQPLHRLLHSPPGPQLHLVASLLDSGDARKVTNDLARQQRGVASVSLQQGILHG